MQSYARSSRRRWGTGLAGGLVAAVVAATCTTGLMTGVVTGASAAPAGESTQVSRTMLVLDSSKSMARDAGGGRPKIDAAKQALRDVVDALPDEAEVGLRVFGATVKARSGEGACTDSQSVVSPTVDNRDELRNAVEGYTPYGETPIPHALREAAADLGDSGPRSIILVSDGESSCDPDPCVVAEELAEDGIDLRIDVVGLSVNDEARDQLSCIAEAGGGAYFDADDADEVSETLVRLAQRAAKPFVLRGDPIEGGRESVPTPITTGRWVDDIGKDSKFYVFTRRTEGTTLRVTALTQGELDMLESVNVHITDAEGRLCGNGRASLGVATRTVIGAGATASPQDRCGEPGEYMIEVARGVRAEQEAKVGLVVTEEPPVTDAGFSADEPRELVFGKPDYAGTPQPVAGTASFEDAPEISDGLWAGDLVPGEALVHRFRLEHGQSASVGIRFPRGPEVQRRAWTSGPPAAEVSLRSPTMATLDQRVGRREVARVGGSAEGIFNLATRKVSWESGFDPRATDGGDTSLAGDYYVVVALEPRKESFVVPFEIDLAIDGEPAQGPTYADGVSWSVTDALDGSAADGEPGRGSEEQDAADGQGAAADDEGSSGGLGTGLAVAAGVLVVAVLAGGVVLLRRRRSA